MRNSLQLGEVVEVDDTGKIISIPEINLNVDAALETKFEDLKSGGILNGTHLGEVAPWTVPVRVVRLTQDSS
ncbi:hypothetical protein GYMLUDRAFT_577264 [Collybiopsis luxurians FD-317 M1]|uniref:Uncharacterized protein n=1 Tax=Collybiopsis luxurians FD-317 M1 TaxID=944289 RepID=A0A0D0CGL1_9AGAR|nr:hypothetical protein GYMLUDRAFT_577264 [Collybiopsis luxurians FD-317 M1]